MKRFIQTIKNIFKIEELRKRLGYTFLLLLVYRLGCYIVVPGIDPTKLQELEAQASTGLLSLLDMFSGGAFGNASIFALGVMPYISASIVIQLLGVMVPYFQKMQREGESGRRKMNQWTRYLTIVILLLQGPAYITNLHAPSRTVACRCVPSTGFRIQYLRNNRADGRYDVRDVARRAYHRQRYRQRYLPDHYGRYHRPSALRGLR